MAIVNVSVASFSSKRTLFPWNIVSASEPEHSFRDFLRVHTYFCGYDTLQPLDFRGLSNKPPALMLNSFCCYGKEGIILEWPYIAVYIAIIQLHVHVHVYHTCTHTLYMYIYMYKGVLIIPPQQCSIGKVFIVFSPSLL